MNSRLLEKFFKKECSPHEVKQVLEWFRDQGLEPEQEEDLRKMWGEVEKEQKDPRDYYDAEELLGLIQGKIVGEGKITFHKTVVDIIPHPWPHWMKIAAVLFITLICSFLVLFHNKMRNDLKPPAEVTIEAPAGVKKTRILPDGSKVVLNSRSSIKYQEGFGEHKREILLLGEAFFEVSKDTSRPFIVHSGGISTTALGTSFNIIHRPSDGLTEVALASGIAEVSAERKIMEKLLPGERLQYDMKDGSLRRDIYDVLETLAWKEGILHFKKAGIDQVVERLEDWYGVDIDLMGNTDNRKNQNWTYTGTFKDQSLENVLTGISFVKDFTFEIQGKEIKMIFN
jgi:transmembrane sensor